jgi:glycosyltransferase involved in cell wall biosynthesis
MNLSIIIPAYNEADNLGDVIPQVSNFCTQHGIELLVVNDGSKDNSLQLLEQLQANHKFILVNNKLNRGYGGAIKRGIENATKEYVVTIDADGQHDTIDILNLWEIRFTRDADMVVGRRPDSSSSVYRTIGKGLIRRITKFLMPIPIHDLNSGMKLYDRHLALQYLDFCPNSMAYSDVICLMFINNRHLVEESPIRIHERRKGRSTISTKTAFITLYEIIHVLIFFNPVKFFLPISIGFLLVGVLWGLPIVLAGRGVSVGALMFILLGVNFFILGLLSEQLSQIKKHLLRHERTDR